MRKTLAVASGPNPSFDESSGEQYYGDDLGVLATNPPDLLLNPSSFVVPVEQLGRPGLGPLNEQLFQSGYTNAEPINPANEQGVGRSPGLRWGHYPHVQQPNPFRNTGAYLQDGEGFTGYTTRDVRSPIWPEGYLHYTQEPTQHQWWPHVVTVNQDPTPAFVELVPAING